MKVTFREPAGYAASDSDVVNRFRDALLDVLPPEGLVLDEAHLVFVEAPIPDGTYICVKPGWVTAGGRHYVPGEEYRVVDGWVSGVMWDQELLRRIDIATPLKGDARALLEEFFAPAEESESAYTPAIGDKLRAKRDFGVCRNFGACDASMDAIENEVYELVDVWDGLFRLRGFIRSRSTGGGYPNSRYWVTAKQFNEHMEPV